MGIENHKVLVVRIDEIFEHPNADTLGLIVVGGYQVVVKLGEYHPGQLAIYIPPDSVVPQTDPFRFIWENAKTDPDGAVPPKRRRITARRFRKEWSEGLLMPMYDFPELIIDAYGRTNPGYPEPGTDVAVTLGITHYDPPEDTAETGGENERGPGKQHKGLPRSLRGWFYFLMRILSFGRLDFNGRLGGSNEAAPGSAPPIYDVEAYKNYVNVLKVGEPVIITEKIHGSNARYTYRRTRFSGGKMFAGSRKLWKSQTSKCVWRKILQQHSWIETWCRSHEGYTLYGEAIPTQGGFSYGHSGERVGIRFFDVLTPEGQWSPYEQDSQGQWHPPLGISYENWVPILGVTEFVPENVIKNFVDGPSTLSGANHLREGVVIRPTVEREVKNLGRVQLKIVSNKFLEKDSAS